MKVYEPYRQKGCESYFTVEVHTEEGIVKTILMAWDPLMGMECSQAISRIGIGDIEVREFNQDTNEPIKLLTRY